MPNNNKGSLVVRSFVRTKLMEYLRGLPSFVIIRYEGTNEGTN